MVSSDQRRKPGWNCQHTPLITMSIVWTHCVVPRSTDPRGSNVHRVVVVVPATGASAAAEEARTAAARTATTRSAIFIERKLAARAQPVKAWSHDVQGESGRTFGPISEPKSAGAYRGARIEARNAASAAREVSICQSALSWTLNHTNPLICRNDFGSWTFRKSLIHPALEPPNSLEPVSPITIGFDGATVARMFRYVGPITCVKVCQMFRCHGFLPQL